MRRDDLIRKLARTLLGRRSELRRALAESASLIAAGDRSVGDSVDAAVDCERDELDSQLAAVESRELAAIDAALERIRDGCYGSCENCEKPIPATRLQALPAATLCIQCRREEERLGLGRAATLHWERVVDDFSEEEPNGSHRLEPGLV